jgi:hypothetical protein
MQQGRWLMADKLNSGDMFPPLSLQLTDDRTQALPEIKDSGFSIVLFYRGHW